MHLLWRGDELWNTSYSATVICHLNLVRNMSEWYFCNERCFESSTQEKAKNTIMQEILFLTFLNFWVPELAILITFFWNFSEIFQSSLCF